MPSPKHTPYLDGQGGVKIGLSPIAESSWLELDDKFEQEILFKKNLLNVDELKTSGFEQHAEILCKVVKKGKKFYEVPINYNGRSHEEGKKIKFYHIFPVIIQIIKGKFF